MGSLYQKTDKKGVWVFGYMKDGKRNQKVVGQLGDLPKQKQKEIKRKYEIRYEDNKTMDLKKTPKQSLLTIIDDVMEIRKKKVKMKSLSETTVGGDENKLRYFKDFVFDNYGNLNVDDIDDTILNNYTDYCRDQLGNNPTTIHNKHKSVQIVIKHSLMKGFIDQNPYDNVDIPKPISRHKDDIPTDDEHKIVKSYLDGYVNDYLNGAEKFNPINIILYFIVQLGMRVGEVCNMKWKKGKDDIGEGHSLSYVYLNSNLTKLHIHSKKRLRVVPLKESIQNLLKKIQSDTNSKTFVLENHLRKKNGKRHPQSTSKKFNDTYCSRPLKILLRRLNVDDKYSPHCFRHSFVTDLWRKGNLLSHIGNVVGHSDVTMTEKYGHLDTSDMVSVLEDV